MTIINGVVYRSALEVMDEVEALMELCHDDETRLSRDDKDLLALLLSHLDDFEGIEYDPGTSVMESEQDL